MREAGGHGSRPGTVRALNEGGAGSHDERPAIVLVNVGTDSAFKESIRKQYNFPPYGLLSIASVLRAHGCRVFLVDLLTERLSREEFVARLREAGPNVMMVGVPTYTECLHLALEVARVAKGELPEAKVVLGGVHTSFRPSDGLDEPAVDVVVRGEGEQTMVGLLEALRHGLPLAGVAGLAFREGDGIHVTAERPLVTALDTLPLPAFDLIADKPVYSRMASIISSRGCPGSCIFCASRAFSGPRYRKHSADWLFSLLYQYHARVRPVDVINFMDDTFTADRRRLERFHEILRFAGWTKSWSCKSRADSLSESTVRLLASAGCRSIHIGIESGDQRVLDSIEKKMDLKRCLEVVGLLNAFGIRLECSFMIGLPEDTKETIDKTLILASVINENELGLATVGLATPFPGTRMAEDAERNGLRLRTREWRNYTTQKPIFATERFSIEELRRAFDAFHREKALLKGSSIVSHVDLSGFRKELEEWASRVNAMKAEPVPA